jgi:DNA-binding beta-propeller fold protein YncE
MRKLLVVTAWAALALGALVPLPVVAAATGYHVLGEIAIGGEGGWDYLTVDGAARRLYVSHGTHVVVIDLDAGKIVGDIPDTPGVHGIAIAADLNRGFISNGRGNNVTVFDLKTLKASGTVATGDNPDAIRYDAVSHRVFAFNGRSRNATVIDAKASTVAATIPLPGKPEFSVADGKGKVYVNIETTAEMVEIDAATATVTKKYSLAPCEEPSGLALDAKNRRLFSVCGNRMMVVSDPDSGKVIATPAIGAGSDGTAFDPALGYAFSSNGDGTLTIVQQTGGKWDVLENIATERGARTIAVDEKTHKVYLPTAKAGTAPAGGGRAPFLPDTFKVLVVGK